MRARFLVAVLTIMVSFVLHSMAQTPRQLSGSPRRAGQDGAHDAAAAFEEGQNAQDRGDFANAIRFYTEAITADKNLYQAYYQRATALLSLNKKADAEADFRKVIELQPAFARAHR